MIKAPGDRALFWNLFFPNYLVILFICAVHFALMMKLDLPEAWAWPMRLLGPVATVALSIYFARSFEATRRELRLPRREVWAAMHWVGYGKYKQLHAKFSFRAGAEAAPTFEELKFDLPTRLRSGFGIAPARELFAAELALEGEEPRMLIRGQPFRIARLIAEPKF